MFLLGKSLKINKDSKPLPLMKSRSNFLTPRRQKKLRNELKKKNFSDFLHLNIDCATRGKEQLSKQEEKRRKTKIFERDPNQTKYCAKQSLWTPLNIESLREKSGSLLKSILVYYKGPFLSLHQLFNFYC